MASVEQLDLLGEGRTAADSTALGFTRAGARLRQLEAERDRLLQKISAARARQERLETDLRGAATILGGIIEPLHQQMTELDQEVHTVFRGLLTDATRSKAARRKIRQVYRMLQDLEIISPAQEARPTPASPDDDSENPFAEPGDGAGAWSEGGSAERPTGKGALRDLFRRLAETLHPDKASSDEERQRCTEVMKDVTAAYHDGDYSRLLEIERQAASDALDRQGDDPERRCARLEESLRELRRELKELEHTNREIRRSPNYDVLRDLLRPGGKEALAEQAQTEVDELLEVRDFVVAFRDGKISIDRFVQGPSGHDDDLDEDFDEMALAIAEMLAQPAHGARKRGRRRRKRR